MKNKKTLEQEINEFFDILGEKETLNLLAHMFFVFELYDVDEDNGWLAECIKEEDVHNVRMIRTVYLLSKIADLYAGKFCEIKTRFKGLWKRLEGVKDVTT